MLGFVPGHAAAAVGRRPRGFTLVELLVVIVIIGILVGLLLPVIGIVRAATQEATMTTEVATLSQALEAFKTQYQAGYPPDFSGPNRKTINGPRTFQVPADVATLDRFLARLFRYRNKSTDVPPHPDTGEREPANVALYENLDPAEALWLWLRGFTDDPQNPLWGPPNPNVLPAEVPRTPLFDFDKSRLDDRDNDGFLEYYPKYARDRPYIYLVHTSYTATFLFDDFLCRVGRVDEAVLPCPRPYLVGNNPDVSLDYTLATSYADPEKYQIICAGLDNDFGQQTSLDLRNVYTFPFGPYPDKKHRDNITSFADGTLEKSIP
jgi:prepilin-type N-terminal cleavage/methylation domain-containing protein